MRLKNLDFFAVYFYFITLVIEAPLRVALDTIGLSLLIYIREVFLIIAIFSYLFQSRLDAKIIWFLLGVLFFLLEKRSYYHDKTNSQHHNNRSFCCR